MESSRNTTVQSTTSIKQNYKTRFLKSRDSFKDQWQLHLFILLPVIYILIFAYYPMFGAQIAFKEFNPADGIWRSPFVGLQQFETFFKSYQFRRVLTNTLRLSIYSLAAGFPLPILFALFLNTMKNLRYKKLIQTVTYVPHFISIVVLVGMITQLLNPVQGLYGTIYRLFTGGGYPKNILASPSAFTHIYVWSGVWQQLGWNSIIYVAALSGVDPNLHEAAEIDGASRWKRVMNIDLPSILPTIAILLILRTGSIMSVGFEKAYLMQNNLNLAQSEIISTYVYKVGIAAGGGNYSYASAIGLFNSVVNCALLVAVNAITSKLSDKNVSLF